MTTCTGLGLAASVAVLAVSACGGESVPRADEVRVAVAANFLEAHEVLAERFEEETGIEVVASAGSTGQLFAQIVNGAPFDVFLAADSARPRRLDTEGRTVSGTRFPYATGRLALYGPSIDSVRADGLDLISTDVRNVAIANPRIAPYGAAALEVIDRLGMSGVEARLVRGESIGQAYQFVESGAAELGFVALSQIVGAPARSFWIVSEAYHPPIIQEAVLLSRARESPAAWAYLEFLKSGVAREVIESFGYGFPGAPVGVGAEP